MGYAKLAVLISRNWYGGGRCRFGGLLVPPAPLPLTRCEGRIGCAGRVAIIKSRPLRREAPQWGGPLKGKANGGTPFNTADRQGEGFGKCAARVEGLGDKKKRSGALLLALFIAFWWCRSGRSETGETGHRRGLRRGRRSWENPWHRRP